MSLRPRVLHGESERSRRRTVNATLATVVLLLCVVETHARLPGQFVRTKE